jgi:hypothetical protein
VSTPIAAVVAARLRAGHPTELRVQGHSMLPYLAVGQTVRVEPCTADQLRPGELVAFEQAGRIILHRVLAVGAGATTTKGDHAPRAELVPAAHVLGRATAVVSPRRVALRGERHALAGRWLARLSTLHAHCWQIADRYPVAGTLLAKLAAAAVRVAGRFFRPVAA